MELARTGGLERVNEHRPVTVLFVRFGDRLDPASPEDLALFGRFYDAALAAARRFDGVINKVDCGDKGNTLLVLFGAPVAHEDDTERALEFALDLQRAAGEAGLPLRVGVNRARVFCGLVGSPRRREYTVMGDGVNLAARLMQAAADESVFAGEGVKEGRAQSYRFQDLPPMRFKGKSRALPVARLLGRSGDRVEIPYFVGRKEELGRLTAALREGPADRPLLAWVSGEAGVGKSYLVHYFGDLHLSDSRHYSRCHSYTAGIAHYAAQKLVLECLQDLLAGGVFKPREKALALLAERAPDIVEYAPLLLRALGLDLPGDAEPALEPEIRRSLLWRMMLTVVEEAARQGEVAWVVDNGEWLDSESRDFLLHAVRVMETGRFRVFVAARVPAPEEPGFDTAAVELGPLSRDEADDLARRFLEVAEVPEEALRKAWETAAGNPLMTLETLRLMFTAGYLARSEDAPGVLLVDPTREPEMPGSVAGLVLAQADALPAQEREALARLAVAGENIPQGLLPRLEVDAAAAQRLAADGRILRFNPLSQNYYFVKTSFQQALYESLEFGFRREAHREAAEGLEALTDPGRSDRAHLLAWHYGEARDPRALPHLRAIAQAAREGYALKEAASAYGRIVDIGGEAGADIQEEVPALADLLLLLGKAQEADQLLQKHWGRFGPDRRSAAHLARASALRGLGAFPQAEEQVRLALEAARIPRERFLAEAFLGKLYGQTGRMEKAVEVMEKIETDHGAFRDEVEFQMNRMRLAFVRFQTGKTAEAIKTFERLERWFAREKHIKGHYTILNNLALLHLERGAQRKAIRLCERALAIVKQFGIWEEETLLSLMQNVGVMNLHIGNFGEAEKHLLNNLAYARKFNSPLEHKALYSLACLYFDQGRLEACRRYFLGAFDLCKKSGIPVHEILELWMDLNLTLGKKDLFSDALETYNREITSMNLSYLESSAINYRAEGALAFGGAERHVEPQRRNLAECREHGNALEAYRAAKFLFLVTQEDGLFGCMAEFLKSLPRMRRMIEHLLLQYKRFGRTKDWATLRSKLRKHPYLLLNFEAEIAHYRYSQTASGRKRALRRAQDLSVQLVEGLPDGLKRSFRRRYDAHVLFENASGAEQ